MIVVDTSAMVELLIGEDERAEKVREAVTGEALAAPHAIDLEFTSVLRGMTLGRKLSKDRAEAALSTLEQLDLRRYDHTWYLPRIWELRANMWPYDAAFIALAEALGIPLLTADKKFDGVPKTGCAIITV